MDSATLILSPAVAWAPSFLGFILLLIIFVWIVIGMARVRLAISKIATSARCDVTVFGGYPIESLIERINRKENFWLVAAEKYVINYAGHDYLFIDGRVECITFGRFGPISGRSSIRCLVTTDSAAAQVLAAHPREFKCLTSADHTSLYSIRNLSAFAKSLQ